MRQAWAVAWLVAAGALVCAVTVTAQDGDDVESALPACVRVEGIARYRALGYDHVVRVTNGCDRRARCEVWTDVTPEKHPVTVGPEASREVVTRTGSPARAFSARARCELDD